MASSSRCEVIAVITKHLTMYEGTTSTADIVHDSIVTQ